MIELNENFVSLARYPVLMLRRDGFAIPILEKEMSFLVHPIVDDVDSEEFEWFAKYTVDPKAIDLVKRLRKDPENGDLLEEFKQIILNEFCRVRFGVGPKDYMNSDFMDNQEIVFRITSTDGFNWFDTIYSFVVENRTQIRFISVVKEDPNASGLSHKSYKWDRVQDSLEIPIEDFLQSDKRIFN